MSSPRFAKTLVPTIFIALFAILISACASDDTEVDLTSDLPTDVPAGTTLVVADQQNVVQNLLKAGGAAGRRLDFLMQELNREANTLSSKSQDAEMTRHGVDMKVLIEQMREQVQNVE